MIFIFLLLSICFCDFQFVVKKTPSGAAGDEFGSHLDLDGDAFVAGAPPRASGGINRGAAYVFRRNSGSANAWGQVELLVAGDAADQDNFGNDVGISGSTVIVGAAGDDTGGISAGSVYIYEQFGASFVKKIGAPDPDDIDFFGRRIAIDGDVIVSGVPSKNTTGAVYVYQRNETGPDSWGLNTILLASDPLPSAAFGSSVHVTSDMIIVGANGLDGSQGAAYIFSRNATAGEPWTEVRKLNASDGAPGDRFGDAVAIWNGIAAVGASGDDERGSDTGAVYIFYQDQGGMDNWGEVTKIVPYDGQNGDFFGFHLDLDNNYLVVGVELDNDRGSNSGSVYVYQKDQYGPNIWGLLDKVTAPDGNVDDFFGKALAISGEVLVSGAYGDDDVGDESGSAYVFEYSNTTETSSSPSGSSSSAASLFSFFE